MNRTRSLMAILGLSILTGCGLAMRKMEGEPLWQVGTATRTFIEPSHRVAIAALEAMRAELASADLAADRDLAFSPADELCKADGSYPVEGELGLPPNHPAFWMDLPDRPGLPPRRIPARLLSTYLVGRARDGRPVEVAVRFAGAETLVTAHVGRAGDSELSKALFDRIADRLAHPAYPVGSRDEAEAFRAFFAGSATRERLPSLRPPGAR